MGRGGREWRWLPAGIDRTAEGKNRAVLLSMRKKRYTERKSLTGGDAMQQPDTLTAENWMTHSEAVQQGIFDKLDRLEAGELTPQERGTLCEQVRTEIRQLKREYNRMIGCMAEAATSIDEMETRLKEYERVTRRRFHLLPPAPTNAQIDLEEKHTRHFAQGKSFYKLFWVFFIGCFLGVMVERLWCLVRYGHYEPRVGLIYGPFNLVYGIGAWALTLALYPFRNRSKIFSFLGGALVGSVVEYACSWFQEMVFGSVSWDYSNQPFNLNGRICLLYSVYWGVAWIKDLYPRMAKAILHIPNRVGRPLTYLLAAFMLVNTLMTGLTTMRWMERRQSQPPSNAVEAYFDEHYPDERMARIFSNLVFNDERSVPEAAVPEETQ